MNNSKHRMHFANVYDTFHWIAIFNSGFSSFFKPCPIDFEYENSVHFIPTTVIVTETHISIKRSHINEETFTRLLNVWK